MTDEASRRQEIELAEQRAKSFAERFGDPEGYKSLACHAALPLVLTPELLFNIYNRFLRNQAHWVAVVDLLLSDLCRQIGYEQYAMDTPVRSYLLSEMRKDEKLGVRRMQQVACEIINYADRLYRNNPYVGDRELQAQQWAALVYLEDKRERVVKELSESFASALNSAVGEAELKRLTRITEELEPQLEEYPEIVNFAKLTGSLLSGADEYERIREMESLAPGLPSPLREAALNKVSAALIYQSETATAKPAASKAATLRAYEFQTVTVNAKGEIVERRRGEALYYVEELPNGATLDMVAIPAGSFLMGSPETERDRYNDENHLHKVSVPAFYMGKYPVTQTQWRAAASLPKVDRDLDPDPSHFKGDDLPVERVSWEDAMEFCARLSRKTGRAYRLPSEAEWEYACRAGITTPFAFGETITPDIVNYNGEYPYASAPKGEYRAKTTPVGSLGAANAFGLYDMHGNVWEWCADVWHKNYDGAPSDGSVWETDGDNTYRVLRGGSWVNIGYYCRSANRGRNEPGYRNNYYGFRVVIFGARTLP